MRNMKKGTKIGALIGGLVGVICTIVTYITGDINILSLPVIMLFSIFGAGLLFLSPYFGLFMFVIVYGLIGAIIGYLIGGKK